MKPRLIADDSMLMSNFRPYHFIRGHSQPNDGSTIRWDNLRKSYQRNHVLFPSQESNIAIMLAVTLPVLPQRQKKDVQSPMLNPAKSSEHQQTAKKYYNFHRKFQVVATYIDLIFKNFYGSEATDDFTLYHRLLAQEETVGIRIQEREKSCADLSLENPQHLKFNGTINSASRVTTKTPSSNCCLESCASKRPHFQSKNQWKLEGVTSVQLRTLIDDFKLHPANDTPEMFQIIFGRPRAGFWPS